MCEVILNTRQLNDLELLLNGGFYPLDGYMNREDYESCLYNMRLKNNSLWPIPITLAIGKNILEKIFINDIILLKDETNIPIAELEVEDIYEPKLEDECLYILGSEDSNHPYHNIIMQNNNCKYVGGKLKKIQLPLHYDFEDLRLSPDETKKYFKENNWKNIIGFQTRNVLHRSHFELTLNALKEVGENAKLLLHPVVGLTQDCDTDYHTRVRCYKKLVNKYPAKIALLSLLPLNMRMAGPREALWHAIIRKNYGCTHFIVGREHASPSYKTKDGNPFYDTYAAHQLLLKHEEEIGIKIILSKNIVYVKELQEFKIEDEVPTNLTTMNISGTQQREMLKNENKIPEWFSWDDIIEELQKEYKMLNKQGICIYFYGLSGSGKSTLANALMNKIKEFEVERKITLLDADIVRSKLSKGLGFTKEDRQTNVRRIGYVASEIVKHGGIVIIANIAPYEEDRLHNRREISQYGKYVEIFVNTPINTCEKRDVKGMYKLARAGKILNFTGINDPFENGNSADFIFENNEEITSLEKNVNIIINKYFNKIHVIKKVQIFGERCSGTNYLENIINLNFDVEFVWKYWKHFFSFENLNDCDDTLFICITRDPVKWLNSLYQNPHHLCLEMCKDKETFLNHEVTSYKDPNSTEHEMCEIMEDRHIYTKNKYKNIFELRHTKLKFMIDDLPSRVKNYVMIRYEDLLNNFDETINKIKKFNLKIKNEEIFPLNNTIADFKYGGDYKIKEYDHYAKDEIIQNKHFELEFEKKLNYV